MTTAATARTQTHNVWYRLRYTPLRDLLRGRLTARLDVVGLIAAARLPAPLHDLVRQVLRRTRLWRIENVTVAAELIAHFEDGLAAGASVESLIDSFGDSRQASRLIRRATKRKRPLTWRAAAVVSKGAALVVVLCVSLYAVEAARMFTRAPTLARNYWNEINAPAAATPEAERAWPLYRQATLAAKPWPFRGRDIELAPTSAHWPELVAFAEASTEALRLYRAAAERPVLGAGFTNSPDRELEKHLGTWREPLPDEPPAVPLEQNPILIELRMPQLSVLRQGARLLAIDAHRAALAGDGGQVVADTDAMLRMARHALQTPGIIGDLVAIAIAELAGDVVGITLRDCPQVLNDDQLVQLAHRISVELSDGPFRLRLGRERAYFEDLVQRIYTDDGHGDGQPVPGYLALCQSVSVGERLNPVAFDLRGVLAPAFAPLLVGRRQLMETYDRLMAFCEVEAEQPLWQRDESRADQELEALKTSTLGRLRYLSLHYLMPSFSRAAALAERFTQRRDATLVAIALELYRRRHGSYPASLDQLTPRLLPAVPPDRFDGQPLRYRTVDGRPVLYSVGVDRDDDGGRPPAGREGNRRASQWLPVAQLSPPAESPAWPPLPDGDWILWPPVVVAVYDPNVATSTPSAQ